MISLPEGYRTPLKFNHRIPQIAIFEAVEYIFQTWTARKKRLKKSQVKNRRL